MTSTLRRPLTFAAHERATIGDSKFSFTESDHLGWLKCDGRLLSKTEYALLYTVIGDSFGAVGNQFRLPDARGRVPGAAGQSEDNAANPTTYVKGDISGNQLHLLTIPEMPEHNHGITDPGHRHNLPLAASALVGTGPADDWTQSSQNPNNPSDYANTGITINNTGGDEYHNNMQPTIFMGNLFIFCGIYSKGIYPYTTGYGVF